MVLLVFRAVNQITWQIVRCDLLFEMDSEEHSLTILRPLHPLRPLRIFKS